jgi:preprotein translocase subunit SecA
VTSTYQQQVFDSYNDDSRQAGDSLMPTIKDIYAREGHRYKRIAVPITDGSRTLNVSVDMENAIKTNGESIMRDVEKTAALALIDDAWKEHLRKMDDLKASVQTASLIREDPLAAYVKEAHNLFENLLETINTNIASFFLKASLDLPNEQQLRQAQAAQQLAETQRRAQSNRLRTNSPVQRVKPIVREKFVGRNEPCPCGSGKKYKHCHGR